ncbi:flagellar hook-basal body complex protein [Sporomusa acidovorans]|uniref:Flagellar hook protein FlgE n=1 Tax=Sporomusa acidovorans (strain ATCC 49682 / DSM 3132 / Mol) TaxID=1123286 RepID=A0ABZ3IXS1_SPOA4|nr:flagellar hook-basal body complex protein [Sporomusa acidovorans]OZC22409.1 flagellar hook protein FlgE [Sporomusa acidovorans DSM 3132]SDE48452.1 flagellar hook protein FlgE [Sporomusa acidovorans]
MAIMNALSTSVSGIKSSQTALDVIANNIANVNTTGYKSQSVTFSDILSQTIKAATAATDTTGSTNASQVGLGVSVASTDTDMTVGTTSSSSNWTDVALTGSGYFIVQTSSGEYAYTRNGSMSVDSEGNLTIDGYIVCGWEDYTLDDDGNITYNTSGSVEPINIYSDSYAGNKYTLTPVASTSSDITGYVSSKADVADGATGLTSIGDTTDLDFDATTDIKVYDSQGNAYTVSVNMKKCAVEGDTTTWYWELDNDDVTISPSSGYIAFDAEGNVVDSATTLSATVDDTTGYTASSITSSGVTDGDYTVKVTGTSDAYTITVYDSSGTSLGSTTSTTGSGSVSLSTGGTLTFTKPTSLSTGTTTISVASDTVTCGDANYEYSDVTVSSAPEGSYTITTAGTSGSYTTTLTYTDSSGTTYTFASTSSGTDGSATFNLATDSSGASTGLTGTITLAAPSNLEAGTTSFTVASTTYSFDTKSTVTITTPADAGTDDITLALDFSDLTTKSSTSSSLSDTTDGYTTGTPSSYSVSTDGTIYCTYSNGETLSIGQIALATFTNAEGLSKIGDNLYSESLSSGDLSIVVAGTGSSGTMTGYALELSNVDLASEFSDMMISQRAYQANTKVISTADDMLQSLINMVG